MQSHQRTKGDTYSVDFSVSHDFARLRRDGQQPSSNALLNLSKRQGFHHIRADSPRTQEACHILGVDPSELALKYTSDDVLASHCPHRPAEDFTDPSVPAEVIQLRYNHYVERHNRTIARHLPC
jgi:hypothetical protein